MKLYSYFRSSASYRVRIALNLKGLEYEILPVHLLKNGGEQLSDTFKQINPDALVPALLDHYQGQEFSINQSLAIMEYLEEVYPDIPLMPKDPVVRAKIRAFALGIACEIHPVNNLRVLKYLSKDLGLSDEQKNAWYQHWCTSGLRVLEQRLVEDQCAGRFCFGDMPSLADCCLIPQIFNAQRFNCDLSQVPTLMSINQHCMQLPAFIDASPAKQIDAE
ncbi:maleylacetoacetate isomerase [Undibacterium sp. Xuan67W]|uniref:maleylacetoacetate isomerase n=1 Tax=Undibacterium sp. Xuan67W TaxID=3413057 RepID=UPI003BEFE1C1